MPPQCDPTSRKKKKKEKEEVWGFEVLYVFLINFAFSYSEEVLETGKEAKLVFRSNLLGYLHAESEKKKVCPTKWRKIRHTIFVFFIRGILCNARTEQGREGDRSGRPSIPPPSSKADVKPLFFAHKKRDKKAQNPKERQFSTEHKKNYFGFPPQNEWGEREREWGAVTMGDWGRGMGFPEIKNVFLWHSFFKFGKPSVKYSRKSKNFSSFCQICLWIFETRARLFRIFPFLTGFQSGWIGVFLYSRSPRAEEEDAFSRRAFEFPKLF